MLCSIGHSSGRLRGTVTARLLRRCRRVGHLVGQLTTQRWAAPMADGKTFLVTGAGRDIGRAIVDRLIAPNAFGILHYSSSSAGAENALAALREAGADGVVVQADLADDAAVGRFVAEAEHALGGRGLDTLVLNAAATAATPQGATPCEVLHTMLAVNVVAPQRIVDGLALRLADGGTITTLSIAAVRQVLSPDFAFFSATKAAVDILVKGWAVAFGARGIRVNSVAPGVVDANFRAELLRDASFRGALEAATALGRPGQIDDVADVVAFLASPQARWITGQVIDASGGWKL